MTASRFQLFVVPTSMNSMNRTGTLLSIHAFVRGTIWDSFTPFLTTQLTLTGRPISCAKSIPSNICFGVLLLSAIAWKRSSSTASRLTVTRFKPLLSNISAFRFKSTPFVVMAMSRSGSSSRNNPISTCKSLLSSGSPPVILTLARPNGSREATTFTISS